MRFNNLLDFFANHYKPFVIKVINRIIFHKKKLIYSTLFTYCISHAPSAALLIIVAIIVVKKIKLFIVLLGGKMEWILNGGSGNNGSEGGVGIVNDVSVNIHEVGDVFVAVVEIVGDFTP